MSENAFERVEVKWNINGFLLLFNTLITVDSCLVGSLCINLMEKAPFQ